MATWCTNLVTNSPKCAFKKKKKKKEKDQLHSTTHSKTSGFLKGEIHWALDMISSQITVHARIPDNSIHRASHSLTAHKYYVTRFNSLSSHSGCLGMTGREAHHTVSVYQPLLLWGLKIHQCFNYFFFFLNII